MMNKSILSILSVLSVLIAVIKGDSEQDFRDGFLINFESSLERFTTEHSRDSLNEIMSYFSDDNQEFCAYDGTCYVKENGVNNVRNYLKANMGSFDENEVDLDVLTFRSNEVYDEVEIEYVMMATLGDCSGFITGQYLLYLDYVDQDFEMVKWAITDEDVSDFENCGLSAYFSTTI